MNTALDQFAIPGDAAFPLNQAFEAPRDRQDAETLRQYVLSFHPLKTRLFCAVIDGCIRYLSQVRQELAMRLVARLYAGNKSTPSKVRVNIHFGV